jgi:hypothetical protein
MKLKQHILYGGVASLCLVPKFGLLSSVFWAASVLIDIDHYIDFVYRNQCTSLGIKKMFAYYDILADWKDKPNLLVLCVFHTIETMTGIYLISVWMNSDVIKAVFYGMVFHLILDIICMLRDRCLFLRVFSLIEYIIRRKLMIRDRLSPKKVYDEMIVAVNKRF